jgi:hypothetical protein
MPAGLNSDATGLHATRRQHGGLDTKYLQHDYAHMFITVKNDRRARFSAGRLLKKRLQGLAKLHEPALRDDPFESTNEREVKRRAFQPADATCEVPSETLSQVVLKSSQTPRQIGFQVLDGGHRSRAQFAVPAEPGRPRLVDRDLGKEKRGLDELAGRYAWPIGLHLENLQRVLELRSRSRHVVRHDLALYRARVGHET